MARFFGRVHVNAVTGCWIWLAAKNVGGYGQFVVNGRQIGAHVASYGAFVGPLQAGMHIDHLCMNQRCVNPAHLEMVTAAENARRYVATVTHCKNGHPWTPENRRPTTVGASGRQRTYCLPCKQLRWVKRLRVSA